MVAVPDLDLAVIITAGNYGNFPTWRKFFEELLPRYILAAAHSPEATSKLARGRRPDHRTSSNRHRLGNNSHRPLPEGRPLWLELGQLYDLFLES